MRIYTKIFKPFTLYSVDMQSQINDFLYSFRDHLLKSIKGKIHPCVFFADNNPEEFRVKIIQDVYSKWRENHTPIFFFCYNVEVFAKLIAAGVDKNNIYIDIEELKGAVSLTLTLSKIM